MYYPGQQGKPYSWRDVLVIYKTLNTYGIKRLPSVFPSAFWKSTSNSYFATTRHLDLKRLLTLD